MMQRKHSSEAMTGAPGALPGAAIRCLTLIVARHAQQQRGYATRSGISWLMNILRADIAPDEVRPGDQVGDQHDDEGSHGGSSPVADEGRSETAEVSSFRYRERRTGEDSRKTRADNPSDSCLIGRTRQGAQA